MNILASPANSLRSFKRNAAVNIQSNRDISVRIVARESSSSRIAYTAIPAAYTAKHYVIGGTRDVESGKSLINIISYANFRSTKVRITLPRTNVKFTYNNRLYQRSDQLEIQLFSEEELQLITDEGDFRGTIIDVVDGGFISVFSGSILAKIRNSQRTDAFFEQMFPSTSWGNEFLLTPNSNVDGWKATVTFMDKSVPIYLNGGGRYTSQYPGDIWETELNNGQIYTLGTRKSVKNSNIMVIVTYGSNSGDSSTVVVPPISQFLNQYYFFAPSTGTLSVTIPKDKRDKLLLDKGSLSSGIK